MFQAFDSGAGAAPHLSRPEWLGLLARAPVALMERALGDEAQRPPRWLRKPETGLFMVQGRVGGTGDAFHLGEMTVTRCALRRADAPAQAPVGVAYVLGRSHRQAWLAALCDALLQDAEGRSSLQESLLPEVSQHLARQRTLAQVKAQSTRVEFFTLARESDGGAMEDAE